MYLKEELGKDKRFDPQPFKNYSKRKNKTFNSVHILKNRIKFKNKIDIIILPQTILYTTYSLSYMYTLIIKERTLSSSEL